MEEQPGENPRHAGNSERAEGHGGAGSQPEPHPDPAAADGSVPSQPSDSRADGTPPIRFVELTEPIGGLDELYERDRERFSHPVAEELLGVAGRMISSSKSGYRRRHPDHVAVFNANVCTRERGKIWFGDLDLTLDEPTLHKLARRLGETVYVLYETDGRFNGHDEHPLLNHATYTATPHGNTNFPDPIYRSHDGRLRQPAR